MTLPQQTIEVELFARQLGRLLKAYELDILDKAQPQIQKLMTALDRLASTAEPLSADDLYIELDRATTPLNDHMVELLGVAMVKLQGPLRDQASRAGEIKRTIQKATPQALLQRATVEGESIASHLRRRSPSRWQAELMGAIRAGLEAGWERHRKSVEDAVNHLTRVLASTAMWANGNAELQNNWENPTGWRYVGVLDPSTCPICAPWLDRTATSRGALPETPQHWSCRCHVIPA